MTHFNGDAGGENRWEPQACGRPVLQRGLAGAAANIGERAGLRRPDCNAERTVRGGEIQWAPEARTGRKSETWFKVNGT
jgi:hypothetical protein